MLEKPNLPDEQIIVCLQQHYGLQIASLDFLPIGNDATAWVYKVSVDNHSTYFLKLKRGSIVPANVTVPRFLYESGIRQIVSPIPNQSRILWTPLEDFNLILYPFIDGQMGMEIGLSLDQWQELGAILNKIHSTHFPFEVIQEVPREAFTLNPRWVNSIQAIETILSKSDFKDGLEELATFWQTHRQEISRIVTRAEELGHLFQAQSLPFVLCHADIHTANILIDGAGQLFIVDWDQTIFAPKERDLMFRVGEHDPRLGLTEVERAFSSGYGQSDINWLSIAYYRYEWVVQEIADFGERVFLTHNIGEETKKDAVRGFKQLFLPDDVIALAYACDAYISSQNSI